MGRISTAFSNQAEPSKPIIIGFDGSGFDASSFIVVLPSKSSKITFVLNSGEKILKFLTHKTSQLSLKKIKEQIRQDLKTIKISQILIDLRTRVFKNLS